MSHRTSPPPGKHGANSAAFTVATYKPFGTSVTPSSGEKVRYAGEMQDSSSGLYYIFARYMDPELGRFISLDPELGSLGAPQTLNRYVYCANNPLRFTDPTGEFLHIIGGAIAGAVIGVVVYYITTPASERNIWDALAAAGVGAAAGAVTAATFGLAAPALASVAGSGIVGTAVAGGVAGSVGGAAGYVAEGGLATLQGKRFEWSLEAFAVNVGIGAGAGALGGAAGKGLGKLFSKLTGQSYDDIMKGVAAGSSRLSRYGSAVGAAIVSQLPEEMASQMIEWLFGGFAGLENALEGGVSIGMFPQESHTSQSFAQRSSTLASFAR